MKKLPIGISTFKDIIEEGYLYIDKTFFVKQLVDTGRYYFLSRPRRFGKSLFLDTLKSAFKGKKELFKGLYLENHWNWEEIYPVIKISLGAGVFHTQAELNQSFEAMILRWKRKFNLTLSDINHNENFKEIIEKLYYHSNQKIVILIDEYDKPILDNITDPDTAAVMRETLKNFYSVIKDSDAYIKFVFITGVSKFSKVSLFSGLNNLEDITLDEKYSIICGYTQNDLEKEFNDRLAGIDLNEIKTWYNGYNWLGESVYNPFDILLFFSKNCEFRNYWFETGSPAFLIKLFKENNYFIPDLEKVDVTESLLGSFDIDFIDIETLLFQTGYLTIKKQKRVGPRLKYELKYPNIEVQYSLNDYILDYLISDPAGKSKHQDALYYSLESGDLERLHDSLKLLFASIPYNIFSKNKIYEYEGYYASVIYSYFAALGIELIAEDVTNKGRIDLTLKLNDKIYIIEFKVSEENKKSMPLKQIKAKGYSEKYSDKQNTVYLVGITFSKKERNISSFEWEKTVRNGDEIS